ncbi:hypothetical protein QCD58_005230, partial [Enterobacter hormaechei]|nr:hypothetical protein [Enterobacter hormaechei]
MSKVKYYLFNEKCYAKVDNSVNTDDPAAITQRFIKSDWCDLSGLPDLFHSNIDDIFHMNGKLYFLKNEKYAIYDIKEDKVMDSNPRVLAEDFPRLKDLGFDRDIDAACNKSVSGTIIYLFKGSKYVLFDFAKNHEVYEVKEIGSKWNGMSALGFDSNLDAACTKPDGNIYFFKGNK